MKVTAIEVLHDLSWSSGVGGVVHEAKKGARLNVGKDLAADEAEGLIAGGHAKVAAPATRGGRKEG